MLNTLGFFKNQTPNNSISKDITLSYYENDLFTIEDDFIFMDLFATTSIFNEYYYFSNTMEELELDHILDSFSFIPLKKTTPITTPIYITNLKLEKILLKDLLSLTKFF
jgi:hypothetical protein